jgi:hypothetical protein
MTLASSDGKEAVVVGGFDGVERIIDIYRWSITQDSKQKPINFGHLTVTQSI